MAASIVTPRRGKKIEPHPPPGRDPTPSPPMKEELTHAPDGDHAREANVPKKPPEPVRKISGKS